MLDEQSQPYMCAALWAVGLWGRRCARTETFRSRVLKEVWRAYPCEGCPQRDHQVPGIEEQDYG